MAIPHLTIPFRVGPKGYAETVEQDTPEEVAQCVQVLVATTIGQRIEVPSYGIPHQVFTGDEGLAAAAINAAIEKWEPRARTLFESAPDALDSLVRQVRIAVDV